MSVVPKYLNYASQRWFRCHADVTSVSIQRIPIAADFQLDLAISLAGIPRLSNFHILSGTKLIPAAKKGAGCVVHHADLVFVS